MTLQFSVPMSSVAAGAVTAQRWDGGDGDGPVTVLAHGAGSRLDHPIHQGVCAALAAQGCDVIAFNFPYAEAGRRAPDRMPVLLACYRRIAEVLRGEMPGRPLVLGGRSMGGRVASLLAADGLPVDGLALLNYPVVGDSAKPGVPPRTAHWPQLSGPVLFLQGTRDRLFDREIFAAERASLCHADVTVVDIPDADHSFGVPRRAGQTPEQVYAEVGAHISSWLRHSVMTPQGLTS